MITWHPIQEVPATKDATAMIRCVDSIDGAPHLLRGPVMWDAARSTWVSEVSGRPVSLDARRGAYHWALESDIAGEAA